MIEVDVDELVLVGFSERDRERVARSVRIELERLLARRTPSASVSVDARSVRADGERPEAIGRAVARAVERAL